MSEPDRTDARLSAHWDEGHHEDKVCRRCGGILTWYGPIHGYLHTRVHGRFYISDHAPDPI